MWAYLTEWGSRVGSCWEGEASTTCLLALPHALKHQLAAIAQAAAAQNNHLYLDLDLEVSYNSYLFSPKAITDKSAP